MRFEGNLKPVQVLYFYSNYTRTFSQQGIRAALGITPELVTVSATEEKKQFLQWLNQQLPSVFNKCFYSYSYIYTKMINVTEWACREKLVQHCSESFLPCHFRRLMTKGKREKWKDRKSEGKSIRNWEERNEYRDYIDTTVDPIQFRASQLNFLSLISCTCQHKGILKPPQNSKVNLKDRTRLTQLKLRNIQQNLQLIYFTEPDYFALVFLRPHYNMQSFQTEK